jgi:hypothetical protein
MSIAVAVQERYFPFANYTYDNRPAWRTEGSLDLMRQGGGYMFCQTIAQPRTADYPDKFICHLHTSRF